MEVTKPKVNIITSFLAEKEYSFEINLSHVLIFLTLLYAVMFAGAIQPFNLKNPFEGQNLVSLFSIVAPSLICLYLYQVLSDKLVKININLLFVLKLLIAAALISAYTFIRFFTKFNLYSDEVYYAQNSHKLSLLLYDFLLKKIGFLYFKVPVSGILQVTSIGLWVAFLGVFYLIINTKSTLRLGIALLLVIVFRSIIPSLIGGASETHPPLNYLAGNIASTVFGINDHSFMLSILLSFLLFFAYVLYRVKIPFLLFLCIALSLLSIPLIGRWTYYYDQAIFAFFCFSVVSIEIYLDEIEPVYLFFFVSICILFRQSCIIAFLPATVYLLYYLKKNGVAIISKNAFLQMIPGLFALPTFLYALLKGTPTTPSLLGANPTVEISLLDKLFSLDLLVAVLPLLNLYALLIPLAITVLIYQRKFLLLASIVPIYAGYITLHLIGTMPPFEAKYFLEAYGFLLVLSLIVFFTWIEQKLKSISIAVSITLLFLIYKETWWKSPYGMNISQENKMYFQKVHENHFSYINEYIASNKIYNRALVLGIDYGTFPFILNGISGADLNTVIISRSSYFGRKYGSKKNAHWLDVDLNAIQNNDSTDFVFVTDYLVQKNQPQIDSLISTFGWHVIMNVPGTKSTTGCIGLSRHKF